MSEGQLVVREAGNTASGARTQPLRRIADRSATA